jgi:TRAP-type C4-dicarboxylate transport system permease large subunit
VVFNLCIGMITPPVGNILFILCSITKLSMESLVRELWPFILVEIVVLLLITYVPATTLVVPRLFGY